VTEVVTVQDLDASGWSERELLDPGVEYLQAIRQRIRSRRALESIDACIERDDAAERKGGGKWRNSSRLLRNETVVRNRELLG